MKKSCQNNIDGESKRLKLQRKSSSYSYKFLKKLRNFYKKLTFSRYDKIRGADFRARDAFGIHDLATNCFRKLTEKLRLHSANCGAILIEFATCIPILVILLFYINDLVRIKRYYSQTEFVAQQMANVLQNISQKRKDKRIKLDDIKYAIALAYQTIYPGKTMYWQNRGMPLVHEPHPMIYYVKGNNDGTATTVWRETFWGGTNKVVSPAKLKYESYTNTHDVSVVNMGTNVQPSQIYPTLKIGPGEVKIIVEALIFFKTDAKDINGKSGYTAREVFGCLMASPRQVKNANAGNYVNDMSRGGYFNSVVIFTPKSGLFSETAPS